VDKGHKGGGVQKWRRGSRTTQRTARPPGEKRRKTPEDPRKRKTGIVGVIIFTYSRLWSGCYPFKSMFGFVCVCGLCISSALLALLVRFFPFFSFVCVV